jgi:hypothetical protein
MADWRRPRQSNLSIQFIYFFRLFFLSFFICHTLAALELGWSLPFCPEKRSESLHESEGSLLLCSKSNRPSCHENTTTILVLRGSFACQQVPHPSHWNFAYQDFSWENRISVQLYVAWNHLNIPLKQKKNTIWKSNLEIEYYESTLCKLLGPYVKQHSPTLGSNLGDLSWGVRTPTRLLHTPQNGWTANL